MGLNKEYIHELLVEAFTRAVKKFRPQPVTTFYEEIVHKVLNMGLRPATNEMIEIRAELERQDWDTDQPHPFIEFSNHERTGPIDWYLRTEMSKKVETLIGLHKKERVWLLPVVDDQEHISWDFYVAIGTEKEVVKQLKSLLK